MIQPTDNQYLEQVDFLWTLESYSSTNMTLRLEFYKFEYISYGIDFNDLQIEVKNASIFERKSDQLTVLPGAKFLK